MPVNDYILLRKGSSTEWSNANPVLATGEPGYDITNNILKVGDGTKSWNNLEPINTALNNFNIYGTGNIDISGNITANTGNFDVISFNVDNESILTKGQISWDDTEGTMDIGLTDNTTIHIGQHRYFRVRNETGDTLYKGQPVYATGVHSNGIITPSKYIADGTIREVRFMGLMLEDLSNNNNGYAIDFGHLEGMDLDGSATNFAVGDETWVAGDILYVHPTGAGKLTNVEPKHSISVAIVLDPGNGNGNGRMFVRTTSYGHLDDNHDVAVSGATNGQFLQYNSDTDYWLPSSSGNFTTLQVSGSSVLLNIVEDTSPQLGGNLDLNSNNINGTGNIDIIGTLNVSSVSTFQDNVNVTGNLAVDTNTLFVNSTTNRIGIGTTNPSYQVEIENSGANALLVLDRTDGAACFIEGQATRSAFGSVGATPLALAYNSYAVVLIGENGAITVNPDGDGFTFPTTDGSANQVLKTNGSGILSWADDATAAAGIDGIGTANYVSKWADSDSLTSGIIYDNGTNVGIGTASPSYKLDVVGTGNFSQNLLVNGTGVSLSGHSHTNSDITNWNEAVDDRVNDLLVGISGINISYNDSSNIINIAYTGSSGGVSINNYSDNRLLTSDGSSTGIDAESGLIFLSSGNKLGIGTTDPYGNLGLSNGYFNITGDSQKSSLTVRNSTSDNSSTTLYTDGVSSKLVLSSNSVWNFSINLNCFSSTNEGAASWNFRGCIKRNSSTTSLVGSLIEENFIDSSLNGVTATVVANTGTYSLDINVNGLNSNNILWTAGVDLVQTIYSGVASSPTPTPSVTTTPTITPTITPTVTNTTTPTTTPTVTTTTTNTPTVTNTTTQTPTPTVTPTTTPPYMGGQKYNFIP